MAQKAFMADAGIRLGDWSIVELGNGDMQVSNTHVISGSQKAFRVDKGLRIGDWRMTVNNDGDMLLSETAIVGSQRPFIADAGVKVGAWTLHPTVDGDLYAEKNAVMVNYTLSCNYSAVNEGGSVIISLATTGVAAGTSVPYTITGVTSADINGASLTGNFVTGTSDSVTLNITADSSTEGTETLQLALDNGNSSKSVTINDTSTIDLSQYNYTVAITDSNGNAVTSVNEGENYNITTTTNAPNGTYLWVHLVENNENEQVGDPAWIDWLMDDTQSIARQPVVTNGGTTTTLSMTADQTTETGYEKFTVKISIADEWADVADHYVTQTAEITINDTSQTSSSGTPAQARDRYLRIAASSYNTNISSYIADHVDMDSDHPDWTSTGMTTDVTLVKVVHAPSSTTLELGDTIPSSVFTLSGNSAYHTWGLDDTAYSTSLHAPNGYHISGFTKDPGNGNYTRWNIDYDGSQFGAREGVIDQLFEGQVISNYENTPWITFYDADGYKYEFSHHRRSTNGYADQFEYNSTTQVY